MMHERFPFGLDAEKMSEMFRVPEFEKMFEAARLPGMDVFVKAQEKNLNAVIEANKVAMAGYQSIYKRQVALTEEAMATARSRFQDLQATPMSADAAQKNMETVKSLFEKAMSDLQELADLTQKANTEAFEVIKARFDEAMGEFKLAIDKAQA